jgi:hypothetical protein
LNGVLWGADRSTGNDNLGQNLVENWSDSQQNECGTTVTVTDANDINVCNQVMVESANDTVNATRTQFSMYPRQPFNFAGRTGTIEVNVSDDSFSSHSAWPTIAITDSPAPNPDGGAITPGNLSPRNSVGVDLFGSASSSPHCVFATMWATANYQQIPVNDTGGACVTASTGVGNMNHVEILVSPTSVKVYMTAAGSNTLQLLDSASFTLPLTQGLVWLEDVHYDGDKFNCPPHCQGDHTFSWSDLAFDGPLVARDLGYDVLDGTARNSGGTNIGYLNPATLTTATGPSTTDIANAQGALLICNVDSNNGGTLIYTVNGHVNMFNLSALAGSQVLTLPVSKDQVVAGPNVITLSSSAGDYSNVDLILVGAGGIVPPG